MKAVEFSAVIENDSILIPEQILKKLPPTANQRFRVVIFFEKKGDMDEKIIQESITDYFLAGYDAKDSIYDDYK